MKRKLQSMMISNSSTEIAIQESAQNSSFDVEADSTFLLINNQNSNDSGDLIFISSSPKGKKESIQHANSLSDEYSNSDEENDEQKFDAALALLHEARHSSLQSINEALDQSLVTNNVQENTTSDGLQSSNKMINLSQTSNDPEFGKEIEYKHTNMNQQETKKREKRTPKTFVSQDPTKIFEIYSQPVNKYFNEASILLLETEPLPVLMEDVNGCTAYL
ncbi:20052_t:CDS:2 [Cetraspora pellucida]|uniref:20052_t:CDS:1 n=1 Tax=Cetraspora pellucida TaxID=1433469 RepID=A0A9N9CW17_9GLOM|nr:20052_t:CDS:2 [Cetraspora pellucida]